MDRTGQPVTLPESGFVVEDRAEGRPVYYDASTGHGGTHHWAPEKEKGLRFARKLDGERFVVKFLPWAVGQVTVVPVG